jgi:CRP-like cAMP-binding protein
MTMVAQFTARSAQSIERERPATLGDLDTLTALFPLLASLGGRDRRALVVQLSVANVPAGTSIVRYGETNNYFFFILSGRAVAGREENGQFCPMSILHAGDFFGEIAALAGVTRTADVIAEQATTLLKVPVAGLHQLMAEPRIRRYILSRMTQRLVRMDLIDPPRAGATEDL